MFINFDKVLGVHDNALQLYSQRARALAANIVNADTPNYLARDIDFRDALARQHRVQFERELEDESDDAQPTRLAPEAELLYRQPLQPSLDGNTVEIHREIAAFSDNALRFQATLQFIGGRFKTLIDAFRGG